MKRTLLILAVPLSGLFVHATLADSIAIKPGKWDIKSTTTVPFLAQPQTHTRSLCMQDSTFDPIVMLENNSELNCAVTSSEASGNTLTWEMTCSDPATPGMAYKSTGNMTIDGDRGTGEMRIMMNIPGVGENTMLNKWESYFQGPCG